MKKRRNVFKSLVGIDAKNKEVSSMAHSNNERWLFGVLPADKEAPNIEAEKPENRFKTFFGLIAILFLILFGRSFYLQVVKGGESLNLAQENRFRVQSLRAPRGLFYDRNKEPLVKNIPNYEVTVIPSDLPREKKEKERVFLRLSETIEMDVSEIKDIINEKDPMYTQPVLVSSSIDRETSLVFESRQSELKGFYVGINPIREYLDKGLLSHVLGYVGRISEKELEDNEGYILTDFIGKSGLESAYEEILKGVDGKERIEVDSSGDIIRTYGQESPILGDNLMLTIDFELQKKLSEELIKQMETAKVKKGAAAAINPQNGEILAMVSLPTYNNNLFAGGISENDYSKLINDEDFPLVNRVTSGEYPSGSTIKPFLAAAALDHGTITEKTTVLSTGGIEIGEWRFPDWKRGGHGITDIFKSIAESVNTFYYAIGGGYKNIKGLGPDLMKAYLEKFGFGDYVRTDLGLGSKGHLPDPDWKKDYKKEQWYLGDTYNMSIGQGDVLVTPLQLLNSLATIANGGKMYKPQLLRAVLDFDGNVKTEESSEVIKSNFIKKEAIEATRKGMRQTVTAGSARSLSGLPVEVAGKTGTAEFGPNNSKKHSWFMAFAPYDKPTVAMVILLEGAGEGSEFAVPVAQETLNWYFSR